MVLKPVLLFVIIVSLIGIAGADSEYCSTPPTGITTTIDHNGDWYNITITFPECFVCADNGAMMGDVECLPCSLASFRANRTCLIAPGNVQFNDTSTDPTITNYTWMFGDGNTSFEMNPNNTYSTVGMFTVNHSVTNPVRTMWENKTDFITVRAVGDTCAGVIGTSINFTIQGPSGIAWAACFVLAGAGIGIIIFGRRPKKKKENENEYGGQRP
jgi:PKD repeat protein